MVVFIASFMVLSIMGFANAAYLIYKHYRERKKPLVCPLNHDCSVVTESKWSHLFGVRNEVLGMLFFVGMFVLALGLVFFPAYAALLRTVILVSAGLGVLFSGALVYLQAKIIKNYCFYCLISAGITVLVFLNGWLL